MKKSVLALLFIGVLVLAGCFNDPVQDDLLNYINKETTTAATTRKPSCIRIWKCFRGKLSRRPNPL